MDDSEEKSLPLRSQPFAGLESPFLEQELFARQGEEEWEPRFGALEGENEFRLAFKGYAREETARELEGDGSLAGARLAFEEEELTPDGFGLGGGEQELEDGPAGEEPAEWAMEAGEAAEGLRRRTKHLTLLPHRAVQGGKDVALTPAVADPKIYDGPSAYKIAPKLQACLMAVMKQVKYAHIRVAIADLTKDAKAPEFAVFKHKEQVFVASVAKIAVMLAAFQLRHDLNIAAEKMTSGTVADLFSQVRDSWAATQAAAGKLVLSGGAKIGFGGTLKSSGAAIEVPKAPRLELVLDPVPTGSRFLLKFNSSKTNALDLVKLVRRFNLADEEKAIEKAKNELSEAKRKLASARTTAERASAAARHSDAVKALSKAQTAHVEAEKKKPAVGEQIKALGFLERLGIAAGGAVPASNLCTATVVSDVGFHYIASTLIQTGLFDRNRNGGLWLGADYVNTIWRGAPGGGNAQSATAGSLVAFMTLLAQGALVSQPASDQMVKMMTKPPPVFSGSGSFFLQGLTSRPPTRVVSKIGLMDGADEVALIEREVESEVEDDQGQKTKQKTKLRYVVAALRATKPDELASLIRELDDCILTNNDLPTKTGMQL